MKKNELENIVEQLEHSLRQLRSTIKETHGEFVSRRHIESRSKDIAQTWFEQIEVDFSKVKESETISKKYHKYFEKLLRMSTRTTSRKSTYLEVINSIIANFRRDLLLSIMKGYPVINNFSQLEKIFENITLEEKEYLDEAIGCINYGFYRA